MRPLRSLALLAVLASVLSLQTVTLQAARVVGDWAPVYDGIEYATGSDTSPRLMKAFAMRIDLFNPRVVLYASHGNGSDPDEATIETVSKFMADHNCKVAVNASYGDPPPAGPNVDIWGLTISDGTVVSPGDTIHGPQYDVQLRFTADNVASLLQSTATPTDIWTAVSGNAYHLVNGAALGDDIGTAPRTCAGLSKDKRYLILVCVDGRQPGWSDGATIFDMSNWMLSFGAWNAVNLDGGGSTCMMRADVGIVNRPSGGRVRPVSVYLGVKTGPGIDNLPHLFDKGTDGWFPGGNVSAISYAPAPAWPGCICFEQTGDSGCIISPPLRFVGVRSEVISVRVYPKGGNSASHTLQAFWKTDAENTYTPDKASPIVSFSAQDGWATVKIKVGGAKWVGQTINRLRLHFDGVNHSSRWIVDSVSRASASVPRP